MNKRTFWHVCTHFKVELKHADTCPGSNCYTPSDCLEIKKRTFIINVECPWCTGEEVFRPMQKHDKNQKEERRRHFGGVVRKQMVECEAETSEPKLGLARGVRRMRGE